MTTKNSKILRHGLLFVILVGLAWWSARAWFRPYYNWPFSLFLGLIVVLLQIFVIRAVTGRPAPFQLVLRLADDKGGDLEDAQTFETLRGKFKQQFPKSGRINFDGFDTDGCFIWFYFLGPDAVSVRCAVLSQLERCRIRPGSYFVANATQTCAPPDSGIVTPIGNLSDMNELPSVS